MSTTMRYGHFVMAIFCAWILWQIESELPSNLLKVQGPINGFETRAECMNEIQPMEDRAAEALFAGVAKKDRVKDRGFAIDFHCLPDTIDPREPKAGR